MAVKSLNPTILDKIASLSQTEGINTELLEQFALFVLKNQKAKRPKPLSMNQLKGVLKA